MPRTLMMSIAAVERDTGLSKDTLRVWEKRYGFPTPMRDAQGERCYPLEQVERLRLIKRLLDVGHRPGRVVALPVADLQALAEHSADALVRRAPSLQATADAAAPAASLPQALWAELGLSKGAQVKVSQDGPNGSVSAVLPAVLDASLPANVVRVPAGHADTATLGASFGAIRVEKA